MRFNLIVFLVLEIICGSSVTLAKEATPEKLKQLKQYLVEVDSNAISVPQKCDVNTNDFIRTGPKASARVIEGLKKYATKNHFHLFLKKDGSCNVETDNKGIPKELSIDQEWVKTIQFFKVFYKGVLCVGTIDILNGKLSQINDTDSKVDLEDSVYILTQGKDSFIVDISTNTLSVKVHSSTGKLKETNIRYVKRGEKFLLDSVIVNTPHNNQKIENQFNFGLDFFPIAIQSKVQAYDKTIKGELFLENCRPL